MKLATFHTADGRPRVGAVLADGSTLADLKEACRLMTGAASPALESMLALLESDEAGMDLARRALEFAQSQRPAGAMHALKDVTLLSPIPRPVSIRDAVAFEAHFIGAMRGIVRRRAPLVALADELAAKVFGKGFLRPPKVWYERPIYYFSNPSSVIGTGAQVRWPSYSRLLDYELEFGIFIGRRGRDIPKGQAHRHIAGYCLYNDFSARDEQMREMPGRLGPSKGKSFDTGNAIGPYLVTPDELPNPYDLTLTARINGQEWSRGSTREMHFGFEEMIAFISRDETLYPGEFIGSGTLGAGCGLEHGRWPAEGDTIELESAELGTLRNTIGRRQEELYE